MCRSASSPSWPRARDSGSCCYCCYCCRRLLRPRLQIVPGAATLSTQVRTPGGASGARLIRGRGSRPASPTPSGLPRAESHGPSPTPRSELKPTLRMETDPEFLGVTPIPLSLGSGFPGLEEFKRECGKEVRNRSRVRGRGRGPAVSGARGAASWASGS